MNLKSQLKYGICEVGHLPWVAKVTGIPSVRRVLQRLPGGRDLYDTGWKRLHPFDRLHGIDTSNSEPVDRDLNEHPSAPHAHFYAGSQPGLLRAVLGMVPGPEKSTFVDLGCGKGRPLFVATEFPFRDIVGVEFSPRLAEIARANAAKVSKRFPHRPRVRIEIGDAGAYTFPAGNIVLFLYNPFGEAIIQQVVTRLEAALAAEPRTFYVIYYNPVFGHCFDASPALTPVFTQNLPHDEKELGFGVGAEDTVSLWRGGGAPPLSDKRHDPSSAKSRAQEDSNLRPSD